MIIADATVLIALAKTGRLGLLRELYGEVAVGPRVKLEVVEGGRAIHAPEVNVIEAAFEAKWMREITPTAGERRLSPANAEISSEPIARLTRTTTPKTAILVSK